MGYHEPIVECDIFFQKKLMLYIPQYKHGRSLPMKMQWVELHQWGPMVGTPSTLEKGFGQ
jgi:hypothetical protein